MKIRLLPYADLFRDIYTGFILGIISAFLLQRNIWIDMRFNAGILIPLLTLLTVFIFRGFNMRLGRLFLPAVEIIFIGLLYSFYHFKPGALLVVPAAIVRDGFYLGEVNLGIINIFLLALFIGGNISWIINPNRVNG